MRTVYIFTSVFTSLFILLALCSYSIQELGFVSASTPDVLNHAGVVGAYIADTLFLWFGLCSFFISFLFAMFSYKFTRSSPLFSSVIGGIFCVFSLCYYCELLPENLFKEIPSSNGGWLGQLCQSYLPWLLGKTGSLLFCHSITLSGISLLFDWSLLTSMEKWLDATLKAAQDRKSARTINVRSRSKSLQKNPLDLMTDPKQQTAPKMTPEEKEEEWQLQGQKLINKLKEYGVAGKITAIVPGPVIVRFEIQLSVGQRSSKVVTLAKDLARALMISHLVVIENIPGKACIGLEIPLKQRQEISLKPLLKQCPTHFDLPLVLGVCSQGEPVVVDLAKLPHLLVAGSTGSGKSVGINAMLISLLTQRKPEELRLVLIDPKVLEFARYHEISHLACPVISESEHALAALKWAVDVMEQRYQLLAKAGVRHIREYNQLVSKSEEHVPLPYIVVVIDELADLMMMSKKAIEEPIARLTQKARACGIHLILATQRPSVDVITGLIKANVPARLAYAVSSKIDSRTIIDQQGADHLLGMGDSYFIKPGETGLKRVHGAYVSDDDLDSVVTYCKQSKVNYLITLEQIMFKFSEMEHEEGVS